MAGTVAVYASCIGVTEARYTGAARRNGRMATEEGNEEDYDCYDSFHWVTLLIIGIRDYAQDAGEIDSIFVRNNNYMKNSRISIQNRLPPQPPSQGAPQSRIGSLKAIMNQGRVPLSQYMNRRPLKHPTQPQPASYFDKLKAKLTHDAYRLSYDPQAHNDTRSKEYSPMQIEQPSPRFNQDRCELEGTAPISALKNRGESSCKERCKSTQGNYRKPLPLGKINHPPLPSCQPTSTKAVEVERSVTVTSMMDGKEGYYWKGGKQVKGEKVDYRRFSVLVGGQDISVLELEEVLGCGANATVRSGRDPRSCQRYAVKVYEKYKLVEVKKKKRVMQEIEILSKLDHSNIIKLVHCFEDKRQIHLLFEFIEGAQTLQEFIRANAYSVPEKEKKEIGVKIAHALSYLHDMGVSHRDIKNENVILGRGGEVKLIDFGFATSTHRTELQCGTPNYMAPELFQKKCVYDPTKVDVWALGVLLFYLHEGCYPFKGYNEKDLSRNISSGKVTYARTQNPSLRAIEAALKINPDYRCSLAELLSILCN